MIVGNSIGLPLYNGIGLMSAVNSSGTPTSWPGDGFIRFLLDATSFDTASAYREYGYDAQPASSTGESPYLPEGWDYSSTVWSYGTFTYNSSRGYVDWGAPYIISGTENGVPVYSATMINPQNGDRMFRGFYPEDTCGVIINASNDGFSGLSSVRSAFGGSMTSVDAKIRANDEQFGDETYMFGGLGNLTKARIHWVGTGTADTTMMFYRNYLSSLELIADYTMNLKLSSTGDPKSGFAGSGRLRTLSITSPSIGEMPWAFSNNSSLTSVTISAASIDNMSAAFRDCRGLREVDMGDCFVNNADEAFIGCSSLSSLPIKNYGSSTRGTYESCLLHVPADVDISLSQDAGGMFSQNSGITSAHIKLGTAIENLNNMFRATHISSLEIEGPSSYPMLSDIGGFVYNTHLTGYDAVLKLISSCDGGVLTGLNNVFMSYSGQTLQVERDMNLVLPGTSGSYAPLSMTGFIKTTGGTSVRTTVLSSFSVLFDNGGWVDNTESASASMYEIARGTDSLRRVSISSNRAGKILCVTRGAFQGITSCTSFNMSPISSFTITDARDMMRGTRVSNFNFGGAGTEPSDFVSGHVSAMFANNSSLTSITVGGTDYTSLSAAIDRLSASYSSVSRRNMFSGCSGFPDYSAISAASKYSSWIKGTY